MDYTRIRVGSDAVGIMGLKQAMEELAPILADKSDEEVQATLLEHLSKKNYIPNPAREEYGQALLREFRKFLGQPYEEGPSKVLEIKVLGPGCAQCDRLEQILMEVLTETGAAADVDHVRDIKEIGKYGVMGTPALMINGKVVCVGRVPPRNKVREWLVGAGAISRREQ